MLESIIFWVSGICSWYDMVWSAITAFLLGRQHLAPPWSELARERKPDWTAWCLSVRLNISDWLKPFMNHSHFNTLGTDVHYILNEWNYAPHPLETGEWTLAPYSVVVRCSMPLLSAKIRCCHLRNNILSMWLEVFLMLSVLSVWIVWAGLVFLSGLSSWGLLNVCV